MIFWMYFSAASIFMLAYLGAFMALCIVELVRAVTLPPGVGEHPACGGCGYQVVDFPEGGRCPECGAFLIKAGLLTRRAAMRYRGTTYGLIVGWTSLVLIVAVPIGAMVFSLLQASSPSMWMGGPTGMTKTQSFAPPQTWDADLGQYVASAPYRVDFDMDVTIDNFQTATAGTIEIALRVGEQKAATAVITINDYIELRSSEGEVIGEFSMFDDDTALALYEAAGLDTTSQAIVDEAKALAVLVQRAQTTPTYFEQAGMMWNAAGTTGAPVFSPQAGQSSYSTASTGNDGMVRMLVVMGTYVALFVVVYVIGLVLLIRRRRRLLSIL